MTIGVSFEAYKSCENDEIADMWPLILQELAFFNATTLRFEDCAPGIPSNQRSEQRSSN